MNALPEDFYYQFAGRSAVAYVDFANVAAAGNTITVNGTAYTYGTSWGGSYPNGAYARPAMVRELAQVINGQTEDARGSLLSSPNVDVFARAAGNRLLLFARDPGTAGNSYTLATNNSAAFVVSGATFSGGTDPASAGTVTAIEPSVTAHIALLGASATQIIPSGAKGWSFVIMTGTATVGGVTGIPATVGDQDSKTLAASLTITTDAASSAYVRWNT